VEEGGGSETGRKRGREEREREGEGEGDRVGEGRGKGKGKGSIEGGRKGWGEGGRARGGKRRGKEKEGEGAEKRWGLKPKRLGSKDWLPSARNRSSPVRPTKRVERGCRKSGTGTYVKRRTPKCGEAVVTNLRAFRPQMRELVEEWSGGV
jgi:hypothetical protein